MPPTKPSIALLVIASLLLLPLSALADEPPPATRGWTSRPMPGDPGAVSWSGGDWVIMVAAATVGELAGGVGAVALYWSLTGACENRTVERCYDGHRPSSLAIGLAVGAPLGATIAAGIAGGALGYGGTALRTYSGALVGLVVFAAAFGPFVDPEVSVPLGTALALASMPWSTALFYYISQENAVRIGETASVANVAPDGGLRWGLPAPVIVPVGADLRVSIPLVSGTF